MMRLDVGVLVLGAALIVAPGAAQANELRNGNFGETITVVSPSSGYPV
jgi:hypothetical protein